MRWGAVTKARPLVDGVRTLLRKLPTISRPLTAVTIVLVVLTAAAPIAMVGVAATLVDRLVDGRESTALLVALPVLLFGQEAGRQVLNVIAGTLSRRVDGALRDRVLAASLDPVGIAHLEDPELRAVFGAARNLSPFFFSPGDAAAQLPWAFVPRLQSLLAIALLTAVIPWVGIVALVVFAISQVMAVGTVIDLVTSSAFGMFSPDLVYLRELPLSGPPAKEVRVFGLGAWVEQRFAVAGRRKLDDALVARRGRLRSFVRVGGVLGAGLAVCMAGVGVVAARGDLSVAALIAAVLALHRAFMVPNTMPDISIVYGTMTIAAVDQAAAAAVRTVARPAEPRQAPGPRHELAFRDVRFTYPGSEQPVLDGLDLVIPAGQQLAIVGLNGSGKTTLVKLLCRLYDPDAGSVGADGVDLRDVDPEAWRAQLGILFQDFLRWELPAIDNVALQAVRTGGVPDDVSRAAQRAGIATLIDGLPSSWDTPLSASRTGGVDLSGGQWQRVALARALHAVDSGARVLVMDEPTANLDAHGEQQFFDEVLANPAVRTAADGEPVTTILISHRFATVRHADRIVVLREGRIVEDGVHADLVAAGGEYASLFEAQAKSFREEAS